MSPAVPLAADKPLTQPGDRGISGCLVTTDGRVLEGRIFEQGEAYRVDALGGSVVIAFEDVLTMGDSLVDAYARIRDSRKRPGAEEHVDLGRWCLQNKLYEEASDEARAALQLEPRRQAALELLSQADKALATSAPVATPAVVVAEVPPQAEFVRRIQPLLINKCGNANCHGASATSSFQLQAVATGSRPQNIRTMQNLEAVFEQIDRDHPDQSPLLVKSHNVTGPHANVFTGPRSKEHSERLVLWVRQFAVQGVVAPLPSREDAPRPLLTFRPKMIEEQPASEVPSPILPASAEAIEPSTATTASRKPRPKLAPLRSPEVMRLLETQAPDAFDPEVFNRIVHETP